MSVSDTGWFVVLQYKNIDASHPLIRITLARRRILHPSPTPRLFAQYLASFLSSPARMKISFRTVTAGGILFPYIYLKSIGTLVQYFNKKAAHVNIFYIVCLRPRRRIEELIKNIRKIIKNIFWPHQNKKQPFPSERSEFSLCWEEQQNSLKPTKLLTGTCNHF